MYYVVAFHRVLKIIWLYCFNYFTNCSGYFCPYLWRGNRSEALAIAIVSNIHSYVENHDFLVQPTFQLLLSRSFANASTDFNAIVSSFAFFSANRWLLSTSLFPLSIFQIILIAMFPMCDDNECSQDSIPQNDHLSVTSMDIVELKKCKSIYTE